MIFGSYGGLKISTNGGWPALDPQRRFWWPTLSAVSAERGGAGGWDTL